MNAARTTYLVLPAVTDLVGQLRIVSRRARCCLTLADYRRDSTGWGEVGLINALGYLVCLDAPPGVWTEFLACEPIRPSTVVCLPDEVAP